MMKRTISYYFFLESATLAELSPNSEIIESFRKFDVFDLFVGYRMRLRTQNSSVGVILALNDFFSDF